MFYGLRKCVKIQSSIRALLPDSIERFNWNCKLHIFSKWFFFITLTFICKYVIFKITFWIIKYNPSFTLLNHTLFLQKIYTITYKQHKVTLQILPYNLISYNFISKRQTPKNSFIPICCVKAFFLVWVLFVIFTSSIDIYSRIVYL